MQLTREQQDVIAPGIWLTILLVLGFFARPQLIPGAVVSTVVLGIYYAARDASTGHD